MKSSRKVRRHPYQGVWGKKFQVKKLTKPPGMRRTENCFRSRKGGSRVRKMAKTSWRGRQKSDDCMDNGTALQIYI